MLNKYHHPSETSVDFPYPFSSLLTSQPKYSNVCSEINDLLADSPLPLENLWGTSGSQTALKKDAVTRERIILLLNMCLWNDLPIHSLPVYAPADWHTVAEQQAVIEFGTVSEVALVYSDHFKAEQIFTIFVKGDHYNDALMDKLLDRELRLLDALQSRPIAVHYFPFTAETSTHSLIRESAKLIFQG